MRPRKEENSYASLIDFVERHPRLFVLTGAGCSTDSGIPDYRDTGGGWKGAQPMTFQSFIADPAARQRYWARSLVGWRRVRGALPNDAHRALARLEHRNRIRFLVTQNVDGLHQAAGSRQVLDLHGRLDRVDCLDCGAGIDRSEFQEKLRRRNPGWSGLPADTAPDGDAKIEDVDFSGFAVPACACCGGVLKPAVVFFGESVPKIRVAAAMSRLDEADAMLVVGSSLMVYSGFRFAKAAANAVKPIAAVNLGRTRADELLALKIEAPCSAALSALADTLSDRSRPA